MRSGRVHALVGEQALATPRFATSGRVVITDKAGAIVATLGDNPDKEQWAKYKLAPELWREGIFVAPHGVAFDSAGNLFVQDWNYIGRLTKLRRAPQSLALAQ